MRSTIPLVAGLALAISPLAAQETVADPTTPPEVAEKSKADGIQIGAIEVLIAPPGGQIYVRQEPRGDPRDAPPPTIIPEKLCPAGKVHGQFEPAQGVWQDDPSFEDRPGKQITKLTPVLWHAELPMVTGRKSLLFGIERAVGGAEPQPLPPPSGGA